MTEREKMQAIADQIKALTLHPATGEEYDAGYIAARNDAFAIVQEVIDNLPQEPTPEAGLSIEEQKAQGERCGCHGSDDYCPCQNVPDTETRRERDALIHATGVEKIGYVTAGELAHLRLGVSCIDLFGEVVPAGVEMVPVFVPASTPPPLSPPSMKGGEE